MAGWVIVLGLGPLAETAQAHQPEVVGGALRVRVTEPEVSKAYYARLVGVPARYVIASSTPFTLYAQVTVPDIAGAHRDYQMTIWGPSGQMAKLTTRPIAWKRFYEPFGGDHYLTGPEFRRRVGAGRYTVEVSRPSDRGTYVLAIGETERWNVTQAISALFALPEIKQHYFHQSLARAWLTRTVPVLAAMLALAGLTVWLIARLLRRLAGHRPVSRPDDAA